MKKLCLLLSICIGAIGAVYAQNSGAEEFRDTIEYLLAPLDMNDVSTGLLLDKNIRFTDLNRYDGANLNDYNLVDPTQFGLIYASLYGAPVTPEYALPSPIDAYSNTAITLTDEDVIPLGILLYDYNEFKETALDEGILKEVNGQFFPSDNYAQGAYEEKRTFAVTPLVNKSRSGDLTIAFSPDYFLTNQTEGIQTLELDTGTGFQPITDGSPITIVGTENSKVLNFRCLLTDGTELVAHAVVTFEKPVSLLDGFSLEPTEYQIEATEAHYGANLQVFFNCVDAPRMLKPLIIFDGFDPLEENDYRRFLEKMDIDVSSNPNVPSDTKLLTLGEDENSLIFDEGYDIVFVDFNGGADDMFRNAELAKEVIRLIQDMMAEHGSEESITVLSPSMGGVIAKLALLQMEQAGEAHQVDKLITIEAEYNGANIALGGQYMVKHIVNLEVIGPGIFPLKLFVPELQMLEKTLTAPATRQFLYYQAYEDDLVADEHIDFFNTLHALDAAVPKGERSFKYYAIGNGSGNGQAAGASQLVDAGELMLEIDGSINDFLLNIDEIELSIYGLQIAVPRFEAQLTQTILNFMLGTRAKLLFKTWALPDREKDYKVYKGKLSVFVLGERIVYSREVNKTPIKTAPYDSAPGSLFELPFWEIESAVNNPEGINLSFVKVHKNGFCFVPSMSSTAINTIDISNISNSDLLLNVADPSVQIMANNTTLDNYKISTDASIESFGTHQENQVHVDFNTSNIGFIVSVLSNGTTDKAELIDLNDRIYNFGKNEANPIRNIINWNMMISNTGKLTVNHLGKVRFTDEANNPDNIAEAGYELFLKGNCSDNGGIITINNGGRLEVGHNHADTRATLYIGEGASIEVEAGGTLLVRPHSKIVILPGGELNVRAGGILRLNGGEIEVQAGGNINIPDARLSLFPGATLKMYEDDANIHVLGEMVVTEPLDWLGTGFLQFSAGHTLIVGGNSLAITGQGANHRFLRLNGGADLTIPDGKDLFLQSGIIEFTSDNEIYTSGGIVDTRHVHFLHTAPGFSGSGLVVNNPESFDAQFCQFTNLSQGITLTDVSSEDDVTLQICNFNVCNEGIYVRNSKSKINLASCTFNTNNIPYYAAVHLEGVREVRSTCTINGNLSGELGADTHNGYRLKNVEELVLFGGSINNCERGINGLPEIDPNTGIEVVYENDVILMGGARIEGCEVGIELQGGVLPPDVLGEIHGFGLVMIDCGKLINNKTGIKGQDVLLDIDALDHCGCEAGDEEHRPNTFIIEYGTNKNHFDICYVERDVQTIFARGNYWSEVPIPTTFNVNYHIDEVCDGNGTNKTIEFDPIVLVEPSNCAPFFDPGDNPQTPPTSGICELVYDNDGAQVVTTTLEQKRKGAYQVYADYMEKARKAFRPLAVLPESIREVSPEKCKRDIDVARTFNKGSIPLLYGLQVEETAILEEDLDVRKTIIQEKGTLLVAPNPANNLCTVSLPEGDYELSVINLHGGVIFSTKSAVRQEIDLTNWQAGVYVIQARNLVTGKRYVEKVIKQ